MLAKTVFKSTIINSPTDPPPPPPPPRGQKSSLSESN